jgi:hypothetical protein
MSPWTHSLCSRCWNMRYPARKATVTLTGELETCCFCSLTHRDGIYVRENPANAPCKGKHHEGAACGA